MGSIQHFFGKTGDGAWSVSESGQIIFWNQAAVTLLGYSVEESIGNYCWQLLGGLTPQGEPYCAPSCPVRQAIARGDAIPNLNLQLRHRNGEYVATNMSTISLPEPVDQSVLVHLLRLRGQNSNTAQPFRIYLLGPLMVTLHDGTQVEGPLWNRIKTRALMAYLVMQKGTAVSREQILEMLWPDLDYKAAMHNLNTTVYNLRRSLEPSLKKASHSRYLLYQNGCYRLAEANTYWLDIDAFESGIRQARQEKDIATAINIYKAALSLYRGDYLFDLTDTHNWVRDQQFRLQEIFLTAMANLGDLYEIMERYEEAIAIYQQILAVDCCQETSCRNLMSLFIKLGKRSEAIQVCQRLTQCLADELDILISDKTKALYDKIRRP
jgi:two-component SAPR family response regulator